MSLNLSERSKKCRLPSLDELCQGHTETVFRLLVPGC